MELSRFGKKFAETSGITELMDDLALALSERPDMLFLGGGNPGRIPALEPLFKKRIAQLLDDPDKLHAMLGIYQSPQGDREFREQVAGLLNREFGWPLTAENVAVSNGSQSAFFILFNMLAGEMDDGSRKHLHLPLTPEYIGYTDIGIGADLFSSTRPEIELLENNRFKYHVDFRNLRLGNQVAALCVSRPTNPTGNVLTDREMRHLDEIARSHRIPLIVDGAYGLPFPGIVFNEAKPDWNENTILILSLSKLGLPGVRTGIVIASEEITRAYANANAIVSLACGNLGPVMARDMFRSGEILDLSRTMVAPFYQRKVEQAETWFRDALGTLPWRIHKPQGAIFLWLWFENLPITSQQLYERLKARGVLIAPGHNFFPGMEDRWRHKDECIRVSYAQPEDVVRRGIEIIAEEVAAAYGGE